MELNQWQLHYPFAEQASQINGFVLKEKKKSIYCWTRSRATWTFGESDDQVRDKSESKYQRVQDKSETIEKHLESGLEYYSPTTGVITDRQKETTVLHDQAESQGLNINCIQPKDRWDHAMTNY